MKLYTTLSEIKEHNPCGREIGSNGGWDKLLNHIGQGYPHDKPISLLTILEANGIADCLWAFRCLEDKVLTKRIAVEFAIFCAERVLPIFEGKYPNDKRPRDTIELVKRYLKKPSSVSKKELRSAYADAAAYANAYANAAAAAAAAAAYANAYAAANAAAAAADAANATAAAADAANANRIKEKELQRKKLKQLLGK